MKPLPQLDPDMRTVIEIIQHASEIVSRMPLAALKAHLQQHEPGDPHVPWYEATLRMVDSAMLLELDGGKLSALEARREPAVPQEALRTTSDIPDDWAVR